jgi:L-phenylalanine/L-methionine N-acetyltransferase
VALLREKVRSTLSDGREVVVRSALPRDAKAFTALIDAVATEPRSGLLLVPGEVSWRTWRKRIIANSQDPATLFVVAEVDGLLAGNLGLHPDPHRCSPHVRQLGMSVAAGVRRLGVGSALVSTALDYADAVGVAKIELGVFTYNAPAQALYERFGFSVEGVRRSQYLRAGAPLDEVIMARFLGGAAAVPAPAPPDLRAAPAPPPTTPAVTG